MEVVGLWGLWVEVLEFQARVLWLRVQGAKHNCMKEKALYPTRNPSSICCSCFGVWFAGETRVCLEITLT